MRKGKYVFKKLRSLWFTLPSNLLLLIVMIYPLLYAFIMSFRSYYLMSPPPSFVGLGNYIEILKEPDFWNSLRVTLHFVLVSVSFQLLFGFWVAIVLDSIKKAKGIFIILFIVPLAVPPVVSGLFMRWLFMERWGVVNYFLSLTGISGPSWLGIPPFPLYTIIFADSWQNTPFVIIVLYAGLQVLPQQLLEAARVDGANWINLHRYIIIPFLTPLILFVLIMRTMDNFRIFDSIMAITGGGPGMYTEVLTVYNYRVAFKTLEIGKGCAIGMITLILISIFIWVYIKFLARTRE